MPEPSPQDRAIVTAIAAARAGSPTVIDIVGLGGFGKTTLLSSIVARAEGSHILYAGGQSRQREPFHLLRQWGVDVDGGNHSELAAAAMVGSRVDQLQYTGPVTLVVDDLHWADPESVAALGVFLQRAVGDRLLVVAAHQPTGAQHAQWSDQLSSLPAVTKLSLDGLTIDETQRLLTEFDPQPPHHLAEALRSHTGGSPLFLRAMLREYSVEDLVALATRGDLPAPPTVVEAVRTRLRELDEDVATVLHTLAVLGDDWAELSIVAHISGAADVNAVVSVLRGEQLILTDMGGTVPRARIYHSVVRAAVYDAMGADERSRLHRVAGTICPAPGESLRHRIAGSRHPDAELAREVDVFADGLHRQHRYREAAKFRRHAAILGADGTERLRREYEADFDAILARDVVGEQLDEPDINFPAYRRLVSAAAQASHKRWAKAADILSSITDPEIDGLDPLAAYRVRVLRAWALVASGRSARLALIDIDQAERLPVADPALAGNLTFARGQALQRVAPVGERMTLDGLLSVDRSRMASEPDGVVQLAWRGAVMSLTGLPKEAIGDLTVVTALFRDGLMDFSDGVFHALLGFAQFTDGQWLRASINIDIAMAVRTDVIHPLSAAIAPLGAAIAADSHSCRALLDAGRLSRVLAPLPAAIHAGDIVDVLCLALLGTPQEQESWLSDRVADLGDPNDAVGEQCPHLWYVAHSLAAGWAGDQSAAWRWAHLLETVDPPPWGGRVATWLRSRLDSTGAAATNVWDVAREGLPQIRLLEGLIRVDAARLPGESAPEMCELARETWRSWGADRLIDDVLPPARPKTPPDPLAGLSPREQAVASLLLEGLSYAQIAKELFITRSTVAFHLSRVYAKTGTTSRHELAERTRR